MNLPIKIPDTNAKALEEYLKKMTAPPIRCEIINPSLGVILSWYFENVKNAKDNITKWGAGVTYSVGINFEPAIGISMTLDFVQMLSRKHPVAFAIVAATRAITTLLGQDKDMVTIELKVVGQINLQGNIKYNTNGGFIASTGKKTAGGHVIKGGAYITLSLEARIHIEAKVEIFYVAQVKAYVDAGIKGSVGVGLEALLNSDQEGMFIETIGKFDGIKISGDVKIDVSATQKDRVKKEESPLIEGSFEIVLWEAQHSFFKIRV